MTERFPSIPGPYGFDQEAGELDPLVNFYAHWDQLSDKAREIVVVHAARIANLLHAQGPYMIRNCNEACEQWLYLFDHYRIDAHMRSGHYWPHASEELDDVDPPLSSDHVWLVVEGTLFDPTAAQFLKEAGHQIEETFYLDRTPPAEQVCRIEEDPTNPLRYRAITRDDDAVEIAALELQSLPSRWGGEGKMQVGNIHVDALYRRCGVGRLLFAAAEADWGPIEHDWMEIGTFGVKWAQGMESERGRSFEHETRVDQWTDLPPLFKLPEGFDVRIVRDDTTGGWTFFALVQDVDGDDIGHLTVDPQRVIRGVWVDEDYQGRGVATQLFRDATRLLGRLQHDWDEMSVEGRRWAHKMDREIELSDDRVTAQPDHRNIIRSPGQDPEKTAVQLSNLQSFSSEAATIAVDVDLSL